MFAFCLIVDPIVPADEDSLGGRYRELRHSKGGAPSPSEARPDEDHDQQDEGST
jgi:hypothetical protein